MWSEITHIRVAELRSKTENKLFSCKWAAYWYGGQITKMSYNSPFWRAPEITLKRRMKVQICAKAYYKLKKRILNDQYHMRLIYLRHMLQKPGLPTKKLPGLKKKNQPYYLIFIMLKNIREIWITVQVINTKNNGSMHYTAFSDKYTDRKWIGE